MKLFGITIIQIILHSVPNQMLLTCQSHCEKICSVFLVISSHCPFNNIIQNPMLLRCTPTKNAKQFGSLSGPTFLSVSSLTGVTALWLICAISLYSFFSHLRLGLWHGEKTKQRQANRGNKEKQTPREKNEETK